MLVREIQGSWRNNLISKSHLWNRSVEAIRPLDLTVFLRIHQNSDTHYEAMREVEDLIDVGTRSLQGTLPFADFNPIPTQRITASELCTWLSETTEVRRRALLFGFETGMNPNDVTSLTWKQLGRMRGVPMYARSLARSNVRHIRLDYVFWEWLPNMAAAPLFGLAETAIEISQGLSFDTLRSLYRTAIPIDTHADLESFLSELPLQIDKN